VGVGGIMVYVDSTSDEKGYCRLNTSLRAEKKTRNGGGGDAGGGGGIAKQKST
jgi:hypothetical protein